jgi:hypothetical protein
MNNKKVLKYILYSIYAATLFGAYQLGRNHGKSQERRSSSEFFREYDKNIDNLLEQNRIVEDELEGKIESYEIFLRENRFISDNGCLIEPGFDDGRYNNYGLPKNEGFDGPVMPWSPEMKRE